MNLYLHHIYYAQTIVYCNVFTIIRHFDSSLSSDQPRALRTFSTTYYVLNQGVRLKHPTRVSIPRVPFPGD